MKRKSGFTLIEMLIVIAIIAILAAIIISAVSNQHERASRAADLANARNILAVLATKVAEGNILLPQDGSKGGVWVLVCKKGGPIPRDYNAFDGTVFCGADSNVLINGRSSSNWNTENTELRQMLENSFSMSGLSVRSNSSTTVNGIGGWDWYIVQYAVDPNTGATTGRMYSGIGSIASSTYQLGRSNMEQYINK